MFQRSGTALPNIESFARALGISFTSETRLFELSGSPALDGLLVESWTAHEALDACFEYQLTVLSTEAQLSLPAMLGQRASLAISLADGSRVTRSGIVMHAAALQSDGGLARYRLVVRPWLAALKLQLRSQSFIDKTVVEIVEAVFRAHADIAAWVWSDEVDRFLSQLPPRHYCNQFRESDHDFVARVLAEEGIGWCIEEDEAAPHGHRVRLFADSPRLPEDASAAAGGGLRFHRADSQEERDAIQSFSAWQVLRPASVCLQAWHYADKGSAAAGVPTEGSVGGPQAPRLEVYDPSGGVDHHNGVSRFAAPHYARLQMEAHEARRQRYVGQGSVRTLRPGTRFALLDAPLPGGENGTFLVTAVTHAGINNLPAELHRRIAERLGRAELADAGHALSDAARRQVEAGGYANEFECVPAQRPWRPALLDDTGQRLNPRPSVRGPQSARVVGPEGRSQASGADEIHTDRLGRIKVQFHWQAQGGGEGSSAHSIWVRVAQRYAGAGMGAQFIPRIGQEVLVDFEEQDIDRPVVIAALYNGRGEGGVPATPGGLAAEADTSVFGQSCDGVPSGQGNLAGGHSPAWHGAAAGEQQQRSAAALSGVKTQEFGGAGHNQLVFDDSDAQLRVQAGTSQHASWLNLGHLLHSADNHRGSFRGTGFELRTDAYGALRGGRGVLLSSFGTPAATPAGDNTPGMALAKQAQQLAQSFSDAARTHQAVQQASHLGSSRAGSSHLDEAAAPLKALHKTLSGMVAQQGHDAAVSDAGAKNTHSGADKLPHTADPVVAVTAKAGLAVVAGQDLQTAAGEGIHAASGQDTHLAVGGQARLHTGQAIGMLAGALKAGQGAAGSGLTVIAAQGDIDVQAQAGTLQVAAQGPIDVKSKNAHIDWAAAKKITLATAGGASLTIDAGGIVTQCPGKITVHAAKKSFQGPGRETFTPAGMPQAQPHELRYVATDAQGLPLKNVPYALILPNGEIRSGRTNARGETEKVTTDGPQGVEVYLEDGDHEGFHLLSSED
ncbi:type VI secretion system tip protein VgrG [Aquabacterium sp. A7-Y]|uniref:type VI secretion system Vgr family protein n=1 Tax=Aquabacterium sp. A7-Y TaxID=1349605 RepID=UPI00223D829A|nr:type VI secretion system Vgr family protein [Aquabacterium sp. A7-Y]MCW7538457.1 type VI secretion system tip protein VgrG [Aquabacterium sp. A7-Y]